MRTLELLRRAGVQPSDVAAANQFHHPHPLRVGVHHERFADGHPGAVAGGHQLARVGHVHADRLFAQHVLAGFGRANGPRHVQMVGQRIVDGVDFGIGQQLLVAAVRLGDTELAGRFRRLGRVAGSDGGDLGHRAALHAGNHLRGRDPRRAQYTESKFSHRLKF